MRTLLLLPVIMVLATACDREQAGSAETNRLDPGRANPASAPAPAEPTTQPADDAKVQLVPDRSLRIEAYVQAGIPAPDRQWSGKDYQVAAAILRQISTPNFSRLPRVDSPASGQLFSRSVAPGNLDILRSSTLPLDARLSSFQELHKGFMPIMLLYVNTMITKRQSFDAEVVQLSLFMLDYTDVSISLVEEFLSTLPVDDERHDPNHPGKQKIREGLATSIDGALDILDGKLS